MEQLVTYGYLMESKKAERKPTLIDIDFWLKWFGAGAIFSGVYGVGVQKGMIYEMGLGNASGSYELREIFSSALYGGLNTFDLLNKELERIDSSEFGLLVLVYGSVFSLIGLIVACIRNHKLNKSEKVTTDKSELVREFLYPTKKSYIVYPILGAFFGLFVSFCYVALRYILFLMLALVLLFALLGNFAGQSLIRKGIAVNPCSDVSESTRKLKRVPQCTQVIINGKRIMGQILLENNDGYYIKRNDSFVFAKKNGSGCLFSKFLLNSEVDFKTSDFNFDSVDIELSQFCGQPPKPLDRETDTARDSTDEMPN